MSDLSGVGGPTSASRNERGGGSESSGGNVGMTAQQARLQQMIALQHAHSDSMRKDYVTRTSSLGGDASSSPPGSDTREDPSSTSPRVPIPAANSSMRTFAATERGLTSERSLAGAAAGQQQRNPISPSTPVNPNISTMDPSLLTSLSMATPTLSNVSFAGAAAAGGGGGGGISANNARAGNDLRRNTSSGGGRTAEYAKLLPGGQNSLNRKTGGHRQQQGNSTSGGGSGKSSNGGNIHYQDYSQHRQQMNQTQQSSMHETTVGMTSLDRSLQLQQQNVDPPHQPHLSHDSASVQFHDAVSHSSIQTYGSTAASGGGGGGYHQVPQSLGGTNLNISSRTQSSSHHQFHYGDPSHAFDNDYSHNYEYPYHHDPSDNHCMCCKCCRSCGPDNQLQADNLHRSLCFGAIDGMLTGSGITAACAGLGMLTTSSAASALWTVVALCLAACTSDGVCMCLGHAWSTFVLQRASIAEKSEEKQNFDRDRASSKARLVDMLIDRGMLKIDAMSVADTLEGYPDIFVSALVGDAGALGPGGGSLHGGSADNLGKVKSHGSAGALGGARLDHAQHANQASLGGRSSLHYGSSYGQFDEYRHDPDKAALNDALKDGWNEGIIMLLSFSSFSVIPSLLFLLASTWFPNDPNSSYYSGGDHTSQITVAVGMLSAVMLLLGMWKSRFFDSHWILFGIEAVLVLLASLVTAYSIGAGLKHHFYLDVGSVHA